MRTFALALAAPQTAPQTAVHFLSKSVRCQLITNGATDTSKFVDMLASFAFATGFFLNQHMAVPPNCSSVWVWVVDDESVVVFEQKIVVGLPTAATFLLRRLFMKP